MKSAGLVMQRMVDFSLMQMVRKRLVIKNDTTTVTGQVNATSFAGDGSKLTGIAVDSINWSKVKGIPGAFSDGIGNVGIGEGAADSEFD